MPALDRSCRSLDGFRCEDDDARPCPRDRRIHVAERSIRFPRIAVRNRGDEALTEVSGPADPHAPLERVFHREQPLVHVFVIREHDHIFGRRGIDRLPQRIVGHRRADRPINRDCTQLTEEIRDSLSGYDCDECCCVLAAGKRDPARAGSRLFGNRLCILLERARVRRADLLREIDDFDVRRRAERFPERDRSFAVVRMNVHAPQPVAPDNGD